MSSGRSTRAAGVAPPSIIRAVYHNVSTKHLQSYLNEYAFRFNRRKSLGRRNMFEAFTNRIRKVSSAA